MHNFMGELKLKNPDLKEAEILGILSLIREASDLTNTSLIQHTGLPKDTLRVFKASISHLLTDHSDEKVSFNAVGIKLMAEINPAPYLWRLDAIATNRDVEKKLMMYRERYGMLPKRELDQFFATPATSVRKAQVLIDKGLADNKRIASLGDDDLVSIALLLLGARPSEIVVLDIDKDILQVISEIAKDLGFSDLKTVTYDARHDLPRDLLANFDAVLMDPPYTGSGVSLFVQRGVQLLRDYKSASGSYIFLCHGSSLKDVERSLKVQQIVNRHNLYIEDVVHNFNVYFGGESVGSNSDLYILKQTTYTRSQLEYFGSEIYTFENTLDGKFPYVDHFVFKLYKVPSATMSKKGLQKAVGDFCDAHKLNVMDTKVTRFKGGGISLTYVLSQSNLSVHTWPERNVLHIDLVTCSPIYNKEFFGATLHKLFTTKYIEIQEIS